MQLATVSLVVHRAGIPPNQAAMLVSAAFQDAGVAAPDGSPVVVDGQKLRRSVAKSGSQLDLQHADSIGSVEALFFDRKKR